MLYFILSIKFLKFWAVLGNKVNISRSISTDTEHIHTPAHAHHQLIMNLYNAFNHNKALNINLQN